MVGGANVDVKARTAAALVTGTSNPGTVVRTPGGVGRNVAENLARLGSRVALVSTVGSDPDGDWLLEETAAAGVDVTPVLRGGRTGRYVAVLDAGGELVAGVSDMAATDALGPEVLDHDLLRSAAWSWSTATSPRRLSTRCSPSASGSSSTRSASPRRGGSPLC